MADGLLEAYKEKLLLELFDRKPSELTVEAVEISRGAYGVVVKGTFGERPVAVKKIHQLLWGMAVSKEQARYLIEGFAKEARMLAELSHAHVVKSFGAFFDSNSREPILVMELMDTDLRAFLKQNKGTLRIDQHLNFVWQLASGVQYLHHLSPPLAHRDLCDRNVLLAFDRTTIKIGDLGQAKYKQASEYFNSVAPGNLHFMPPEATSDKPHYTISVDVYSLGVLAIEIATQCEPSPSIHRIGVIPEVERRSGDLNKMADSHPLKSLAIRCLSTNYKQRPVIDQVVSDLKALTWETYEARDSPPTWMEQYKKVIDQRGFVTLHITRCVLIGPPRVGKSSLKLLLINNEPPDQCVEKSTDLMEAPVVLTSIEGQEEKGSQWKELTPNNLQQLVSKCIRKGKEGYSEDSAQPNPIQSSHTSQLTSEGSFSDISTAVTSDTDTVSSTVIESSNTSKEDSELERRYHDFVQATLSEKSLAELQMNGLKMVHVFDCGGQLAFQDTIPLLINAPCAFISVFNASVDLDEEVELRYCPEKGKELSLGHKESQWNMLCRIFSSIYSLQFKCHEFISNLIEGQTVPSSPIAVVGTHKDVLRESSKKDGGLKRTEKKINERLDQLRESKLYDFVREKGCTLDLVANRSIDDFTEHDINSLRRDIERKASLLLKLPLSWIILELFTKQCLLENKFISFHDLHQLCIRKSIVSCKEEFSSLLQVLHVLGFYAFYQLDGVPEDQNWVCTDAATLYSEVTKMLMVQYKEKFRKGATTELKFFGRIKLNKAALQDLFTDLEINIGEAEPMWFIKVLLHIGLAAKVEGEEEEEVFFPLALPFKRSDLPPVTSVATICFTLEFPSGASEGRVHANITEIPRGIYPRLIVHLLSQQRLGVREWKVCKGDSCSWIKLIHCSYKYVIYLNEHVDHIELALVLNDTFLHTPCNSKATNRVGTLCQELREHLVSALGATFVLVFGEQPPERKSPSIVYGLRCSVCRDSSHMAIVRPTDESTPQDPQYTENCVHKKLPKAVVNPDQLIWFSPMEEVTFDKETHQIQDGEWKIWVMKGTGTLKPEAVVESVSDLMPYYMDMTAHLFELAAALGVLPLSRAVIDGNGTPQSKCLQILSHWLETTPRPSWSLLCQKLKLVPSFNAVVLKISKDHHLSTAGDLEPATPIAKRMRLANTGRLPDNTSSAGSNSRSKPYCQY